MIIAVNFPILSNWKEEACKKQGFIGIQTCDLRDTGGIHALLTELIETTHWEQGQLILLSSYLPWGVKWCEVYSTIWRHMHIGRRFHEVDVQAVHQVCPPREEGTKHKTKFETKPRELHVLQ